MYKASPYIFPGIERYAPLLQLTEDDLPTILQAVSNITRINVSVIKSGATWAEASIARHLYCYTAKRNTNCTLKTIARFVGRTDHTTVLNSLKECQDLIDTNNRIKEDVNLIQVMLVNLYKRNS